jgi:hypothetical protein
VAAERVPGGQNRAEQNDRARCGRLIVPSTRFVAASSPRGACLRGRSEGRSPWHRGPAVSDPLGFHITLRLEGDRNLAPTTEARRLFARTVLTVARPFVLLACRWTDTHGHLEMLGTRKEAGELARRVQIALQHALRPGAPFLPAHFTPMYTLAHVKSTFRYIMGQREHHELTIDPRHDASNAPDLLGARTTGLWTAVHVRRHDARLKREHILEALAMDDPDLVVDPPADGLADAAAAAVCLPELDNSAVGVAARIGAVHVAGDRTTAEIADLLGLSQRSIRRFRASPADPAVVRAIRQQLAMRAMIAKESIDTLAAAE